MNSIRKPRVFIASSSESEETALSIQENLEQSLEVTVWSQGIFDLNRPTLSNLLAKICSFDFAIFVFAPDDIARIKNKTVLVTRDNVIFELGLFIGELGEDRSFIVMPRGIDLHLPTDIIGITYANYDPDRSDQNLVAALGPACLKIKRAISGIGLRISGSSQSESVSKPIASGLSNEFRHQITSMLKSQQILIENAFEKFEERLIDSSLVVHQTSKAPIKRLSYIINEQLSPVSKAILYNIRNVHISLEEYEKMKLMPEVYEALEELRQKNLLVPLSGRDKHSNKIPVFWFPSNIYRVIQLLIDENIKPDKFSNKIVLRVLKQVGHTNDPKRIAS